MSDPVADVELHVRWSFAAIARAHSQLLNAGDDIASLVAVRHDTEEAVAQAGYAVTAAMRLTDFRQTDRALYHELRGFGVWRRWRLRRLLREPLGGCHDTGVYDEAMRARGLDPARDVPPSDLYEGAA